MFGVTHAEVGAYLLGLWGLPAPILRVVSLHHRPHLLEEPGFDTVVAVYAAEVISGGMGGSPVFSSGQFNPSVLGRLGLAGHVEQWGRSMGRLPAGEGGAV
jgi:hypothetical protein